MNADFSFTVQMPTWYQCLAVLIPATLLIIYGRATARLLWMLSVVIFCEAWKHKKMTATILCFVLTPFCIRGFINAGTLSEILSFFGSVVVFMATCGTIICAFISEKGDPSYSNLVKNYKACKNETTTQTPNPSEPHYTCHCPICNSKNGVEYLKK